MEVVRTLFFAVTDSDSSYVVLKAEKCAESIV